MSPTASPTRTRPAPPPRPDIRRAMDRRRTLRRRLVRGAVVLGVVLALAVGLWLVTGSSVLAARQVDVTGTDQLSVEEVRAAAAVPLGVPLARQDVDAIARRTAGLPQVASARVERSWPHTVTVQVTERQPLLAIRQADGFAIVDARGVVFESAAKVPDGVVPTDADPSATTLLTALGTVASALPPSLREDVDRLRATSAGNISLDLSSGTTVRWGDASESPLKAQVVEALRTKRMRTIDVSAPHTPATR